MLTPEQRRAFENRYPSDILVDLEGTLDCEKTWEEILSLVGGLARGEYRRVRVDGHSFLVFSTDTKERIQSRGSKVDELLKEERRRDTDRRQTDRRQGDRRQDPPTPG
ncbi:MAG: hypothetical protein JWN89_531 [Parcubacteria group bacterium]|nr:hypothetical protein [Parcubacteria group bacterium]